MLQELFEYPFLIRILNKIFTDNDKIKIIELNKILNDKRTKFTYDKQITLKDNDQYKWYYDCLKNVYISEDLPRFPLPKSTKRLIFDIYYNQNVENYIPNSVKCINFGWNFNQSLENCIPKSVKYLRLGPGFHQSLEHCIPHIKHLYLNSKNKLSNSLTHLTFGDYYDELFNQEIPLSVTHLTFGYHFNHYVNDIPNSVTHLTFGWKFDQPINNIPNSVIYLEFGFAFNQDVNNIPNSIKYLKFGYRFNKEIENRIPLSVTHLEFGTAFDKNIGNLKNVTHLTFNSHNLTKFLKFPSCLKHLRASEKFVEINKENINNNVKISFNDYEFK